MLFAIKVALREKSLTDDVRYCLTSQKEQLEKSTRIRSNINMNNKISMELDLEAEETINKLEKIKRILEDIKELDNKFSINNIIETNKDTILMFNFDGMLKPTDIKRLEDELSYKLKTKCIILDKNIKLNKAIETKEENNNFTYGCDYVQAKDYTVINYYQDKELIRTETIQYK